MGQFTLSNLKKSFIKNKVFSFFQKNVGWIGQLIFTILFVALAVWFVMHKKSELLEVKSTLLNSRLQYVMVGFFLTIFYIALQGQMYYNSFRAVNAKVPLWPLIILFLKRNFVSVFLPAGGISSLAFFAGDIERKEISKSQIHFASSIYGFAGIGSVAVVAIPALLFSAFIGQITSIQIYLLAVTILLLAVIYFLYRSLKSKGFLYRIFIRFFPSMKELLDELHKNQINRRQFMYTFLFSIGVDIVGVFFVFIAMKALFFQPSVAAAIISYLVAILFLTVSPFLRGLGAIELSMTYILMQLGYTEIEGISITLLYRFYQFWIPFVCGIFSFVMRIRKVFLRI